MERADFDELWARVMETNPKGAQLMANEVCSQHEHEVADLPTFDELAPLYDLKEA